MRNIRKKDRIRFSQLGNRVLLEMLRFRVVKRCIAGHQKVQLYQFRLAKINDRSCKN